MVAGEVHVIKELQLVISNLQWRLDQRNKSMTAAHAIIDDLQKKLASVQQENSKLRQDLSELRTSAPAMDDDN